MKRLVNVRRSLLKGLGTTQRKSVEKETLYSPPKVNLEGLTLPISREAMATGRERSLKAHRLMFHLTEQERNQLRQPRSRKR